MYNSAHNFKNNLNITHSMLTKPMVSPQYGLIHFEEESGNVNWLTQLQGMKKRIWKKDKLLERPYIFSVAKDTCKKDQTKQKQANTQATKQLDFALISKSLKTALYQEQARALSSNCSKNSLPKIECSDEEILCLHRSRRKKCQKIQKKSKVSKPVINDNYLGSGKNPDYFVDYSCCNTDNSNHKMVGNNTDLMTSKSRKNCDDNFSCGFRTNLLEVKSVASKFTSSDNHIIAKPSQLKSSIHSSWSCDSSLKSQVSEHIRPTKVFLSEKQSKELNFFGGAVPCAPPATPTAEMLLKYQYIPCLSDIKAQRNVKTQLEILEQKEKIKQEKLVESQLKQEKDDLRSKTMARKIDQRKTIYALNRLMAAYEKTKFQEFCKAREV